MKSTSDLPDQVISAIQAGQKVQAIKLLRAATGLGLMEAKEAVEAYSAERSSGEQPQSKYEELPSGLPDQVVGAIRAGQKIQAIKLLREAKGVGLKEAKDAVEAYMQEQPMRQQPRPNSNKLVIVVVLLVLGCVAYYLFR